MKQSISNSFFSSIAVLAAGVFAVPAFASPIVPNGDFETDAATFTAYPGYVGSPGNPSQVTDFAGPSGGYGVNPSGTGSAPFRDNGNDSTNVLFIQSGGTTLTQTIPGFVVGDAYTLTFDYNARNCCGGTPGITVALGSGTFTDPLDTPVGGTNPYHQGSLNFVASGTSQTLSINKFDAVAGDSTALYDNFVITQNTPEPASLTLLGLGAVGLLARRRRA